jgi:integrase
MNRLQSQSANHPKRGSCIKVEPIKNLNAIRLIKERLADKPRDLALFVIGINCALRASDLRTLKFSDFKGLSVGDSFNIKEEKTGKHRRITVNDAMLDAVAKIQGEGYIFKSQRGGMLTVSAINRLVKSWCSMVKLRGNYGSHTLRKTWAYHQRVTFKTELPVLMYCLNHSSQKQTLDYICLQDKEITSVFMNQL